MPELKKFPVFGDNGRIGTLNAAARFLDTRSQKTIQLDGGGEISVAAEALTVQPDGSFYLREAVPNTSPQMTEAAPAAAVPPQIEEPSSAPESLVTNGAKGVKMDTGMFREGYSIERVAVNRIVAERPEPRQDGDTLILPVIEEVLVTEKRLMLREEIHVTKRREPVEQVQTIDSSV